MNSRGEKVPVVNDADPADDLGVDDTDHPDNIQAMEGQEGVGGYSTEEKREWNRKCEDEEKKEWDRKYSEGNADDYDHNKQYSPAAAYEPPPGYVLVEVDMYNIMKAALHQRVQHTDRAPAPAPEKPTVPVFKLMVLQQIALGDLSYNLIRGQEIEYCPEEYVKIEGVKHTSMRSFLNIWRMQFGPRADPRTQQRPYFQVLNPDTCPRTRVAPTTRVRGSDKDRIALEERTGDAAHRRVMLPGETAENSLRMHTTAQPPPESMQDVQREVRKQERSGPRRNPPRGGPVDEDGLTARGRMIRGMSGDAIDQPTGGRHNSNAHSDNNDNFEAGAPAAWGGGTVVGQIKGGPADETVDIMRNRR